MKILFIGAATSNHTIRWVNSLQSKGHDVVLVSRPDQRANEQINENVVVKYLKYSGSIGYYLNVVSLRKIYFDFRPDVTNVHYASGYGMLVRLAKLENVVISCWGSDVYDFPYKSKRNMKIIRRNLIYADAIASTSNAMANKVREILNDDKYEVTVTPFGVDTTRFSKNEKSDSNKKIIGIVKYLEPIYDVELLIKAFSYIYKKKNDVFLHIYGDGSLRSELENLCVDLEISDRVVFFGTIPNTEVPAALNTFDVFVNCSKMESFGVAIVEAMSCSLPIVATNTEGFKEVVDNGINGIILQDRDPHTMANSILYFLDNEDECIKYGNAGRKKVEIEYDWNKNVDKMLDLYAKVSNS